MPAKDPDERRAYQREYQRDYRAKNRERIREQSRARYVANGDAIRARRRQTWPSRYARSRATCMALSRAYYIGRRAEVITGYGGACACCGESDARFLAIDHVHNDGAAERRMKLDGNRLHNKIIRENFPPKYQILCHNCNFGKKAYGVCPHADSRTANAVSIGGSR